MRQHTWETTRRHDSCRFARFSAKKGSMSRFSSAGSRWYACLMSSRNFARMMQPPCAAGQQALVKAWTLDLSGMALAACAYTSDDWYAPVWRQGAQ